MQNHGPNHSHPPPPAPLPPPPYDIKSTSPTSAKLIRPYAENPPYPPYQPPPGFTQTNFYQQPPPPPPPPGMYPPLGMDQFHPPPNYNIPNPYPANPHAPQPTNLPPHHNMYPNGKIYVTLKWQLLFFCLKVHFLKFYNSKWLDNYIIIKRYIYIYIYIYNYSANIPVLESVSKI